MGQKVWVAVYDHRHGEDIRAFDSEDKCLEWRQEIADEWWDKEIGDPRPVSLEELADRYWEEMNGRLGSYETFHYDHVEIE